MNKATFTASFLIELLFIVRVRANKERIRPAAKYVPENRCETFTDQDGTVHTCFYDELGLTAHCTTPPDSATETTVITTYEVRTETEGGTRNGTSHPAYR